MTNPEELFEHARNHWATELEALQDHRDDILRRAAGEPGRRDCRPNIIRIEDAVKFRLRDHTMEDFVEHVHGYTSPTVAAFLMNQTFYDLEDPMQRVYSRYKAGRVKRIGKIINDHILPISGIEIQRSKVIAGTLSSDSVGACSEAEGYFMNAGAQARTSRNYDQQKLSVYHNSQGVPLILRKYRDESSGLTLQPLSISNILLPAGTIVGIDRRMKEEKYLTGRKERKHDVVSTYHAEDIRLCPIRVTPWIYSNSLTRQLPEVSPYLNSFGIDLRMYDTGGARKLESTNIDTFRAAAVTIMQACGLEANNPESS